VTLRPQPIHALPWIFGAIAIVALLAGILVVGSAPVPTASPSPTPGSSSTPTSTPGTTPSTGARGAPPELVDRWVGPVRTIPNLEKPATRAVLEISGVGLRLDVGAGQPADVLSSAVAQGGSDVLRLTTQTPTHGCQAFEEGTYRWSLSPGKTRLTLSLVSDDCGERAAVLPGTWVHTACRDATQDCLGPMEAGTYPSTEFDAFHEGRAGQATVTVPDGWANTGDHRTNYFLRPTPDYLDDPGSDGNDTTSGIYLWAATLAVDQPADCSAVPAAGIDASADAIARHLAGLAGLIVRDGGSVDLGGRSARVLDLSLDPSLTTPCPWSGGAAFQSEIMFADLGLDGGVWGLGRGDRQRVFLVDVAPKRVVSIWIEAPDDRFDALLPVAMPIVQSLRFVDAGG
jgi:hypothetical protein